MLPIYFFFNLFFEFYVETREQRFFRYLLYKRTIFETGVYFTECIFFYGWGSVFAQSIF